MENYIHYCWFGKGKMPKLAKKCIKSWKKYLPEYEIIEWNEQNFDVNITKFSKKAYEEKKWAFVSDVARVYALKEMGGIYLDTDMMITKEIKTDILNAEFFVGWESDINVAVGVLGAKKGNEIINELYKTYKELEFDSTDLFGITIPKLLTDLLFEKYNMDEDCTKNQILHGNTHIYTRDYFYPISSDMRLSDKFTENTCMIHYYSGSWLPREHQLQMKFKQLFGEKWGTIILNFLVGCKRILKRVKKILRKICIIIFYPLVKIRRKKRYRYLIGEKKKKVDEIVEKISNDKVIFYHEDWIGIKNATKELFGDMAVGITEQYDDEVIDYFTNKLMEKKIKFIAFSGFADGWEKLIKHLKSANNNLIIKVIWHGSMCMNIYDYDYIMFMNIFRLLEKREIDKIAFVKKSMYEFFYAKGYSAEFLANSVNIPKETKEKLIATKANKKVKIGIYASGDRWVKNFYNQMTAASMINNCVVDCIPINYKAHELAKILKLDIKGVPTPLNHDKLLERMAGNDINLYVTFSECAPIIPLESLELGVPCITGNNHHYFEGTKLQELLVVDRPDDVNDIYNGIKKCLEHKEEIMEEYKKWKEKNDSESQKTIKEFLEL